MTLDVGDSAPDFTIPDQNGDPLTLSELRGKPVVLYFYPKASTPGCTVQACGVRDHQDQYAGLDARVLGVSPDAVKPIA
jgi:peroxiredoxin Q/BCP